VTSKIIRLDNYRGKQTVTNQKQVLAQQAMLKSIDVRKQAELNLKSPICIYELCKKLGIQVRFVDINMEGMYIKGIRAQILLSALRPFNRRKFTCAHELGHHVFGHSSTIDELTENSENSEKSELQEFLADSFAGFLLMPTLGVRNAFVSRGWKPIEATPLQIFTLACNFGVGYETFVNHITYTLKMISHSTRELLLKSTPKIIRQEVLGRETTKPLIIADKHWSMPTIDAEVGSQLLLPSTAEATSDTISLEEELPTHGRLFLANRPGIVRVYCRNSQWAVFVRVSRYQYVGLNQYRHLEEVEDE
jgi:Zn-dependent peptidase ImmA (M78 family)